MSSYVEIDNAEMKILVPPQENRTSVKVQLYQVLGARRRRFVREREIFVSQALNKWCELDVTDVVRNWISGDRNLGIELQCNGCNGALDPLRASISALIRVSSVISETNRYFSKHSMTPLDGQRKSAKSESEFVLPPSKPQNGLCWVEATKVL